MVVKYGSPGRDFLVDEESSTPETIWIITREVPLTTETEGRKGGGSPYSQNGVSEAFAAKEVKVSVQKLEAEMSSFLQVVGRLFKRSQQQVDQKSDLQLDEVELSVEISGAGEVKLLGTGGKAGAKGAIILKFKRANSLSLKNYPRF